MASARTTALLAAWVPVFLTPPLYAAADSGAGTEETVITATRTDTPVSELAVPVIVITREEIEASLGGDVADLLAGRAGIEVARTGGPGQPASIFMRGTDSDHTSVLIDGVRINPGTIGGAQVQNILPESIERIEIVQGARSTLYGTDAIGGVINIITRAGAAQGESALVDFGRWNTRTFAADGGADLSSKIGVGGSVDWYGSDGFPALVNTAAARGFIDRSGNVQLRLDASDDLTLRARAWRASGTSEYSDYLADPIDENFLNSVYSLDAQWTPSSVWNTHVTVSQVQDDLNQNQSSDFDHTLRDAVDAQSSWRVDSGQEITAGANLAREHTQSLSFGTGYDVRTDVDQLFLQDQLHADANDLLLAGAYIHDQSFGNRGTWNAEYGRSFGAGWRASLAAGTAFHAPDSTDLFGYGGNPLLKPEFSHQIEVGLSRQLGPHQSVRLDVFENDIDDLIEFAITDPVTFAGENENIDRVRIRGLEATYQLQADPWRLRVEGTLQDPEDLSTGEVLLRRARDFFSANLDRRVGALDFSAGILSSGARQDVGSPAQIELGGYTLLNLAASYQPTQNWTLQARLDNALNRQYALVNGYNTPDRSWTLAVRYRIR